MKTRLKQLISLLCVVSVFAGAVLSTNFLSNAETNNGQLETLPTDMTEITFRDFGYADGEYTRWPAAKQYNGTTMDNTLFSGKVIFPEKKDVFIQYGGKVAGGGFNLGTAEKNGEYYLRLYDTNQDKSGQAFSYDLHTSVADVDTFVGKEIELHISMEYVNHDGGTAENDLKLGIWFNQKLYDNKYYYINNYVDKTHCVGTYLGFYVASTPITIKSTNVKLPTDMTEITFEDFDIADGQYDNTFVGTYAGSTMDNTLFSGKIKFPESGETHFMYGGKAEAGWNGFILTNVYDTANNIHYLRLYDSDGDKDGKSFNDIKFYSDVAGVQLVGKELTLNYTIEFVNHDGGNAENDVKLGVWFGGKLYNNEYIYINDYANTGHSIGTTMTIWNRGGAVVHLKSCNYQLPTDLTEITFRDFGVADGEVKSWKGYQYSGTTMENTLFSGKITFPENKNTSFQYGGIGAWNGGFELLVDGDTNSGFYLRLHDTQNKFNYDLSDTVAGMKLVGQEIEVHFSLEYVNHDGGATKNDLKLGLWFGDKLYGDAYYYFDNYVDAAKSIGKWMTIIPKNSVAVKVKSADFRLPTNMQHISFRDFGLADGTVSDNMVKGQYEGETMDNTLFSGKITFTGVGETHVAYGGTKSLSGFILTNVADSQNGDYLRLYDSNADRTGKKFNDYKFYSDVAGVQLVGKELDLSISMEYVNNDNGSTANDLKLGLWFGGKLYNNTYIYINDYVDNGHSIGTVMTIWNRNGATLGVKSVGEINWKPLPTGMKEITFRDFNFIDGDYSGWKEGKYDGETLDGTLFSGKVTFTEAGDTHLMYGGKSLGGGISLAIGHDNVNGYYLRLRNPKASESTATFQEVKFFSDVAGVQLVGKELDLNFTTEYIDNDGKGSKNDLKFGVWFGGKLYNNSYIFVNDYVDNSHSMGTVMTLVTSQTTIAIKSVGDINWKPLPTGLTEITFRDFGFIDGDYTAYPNGQYDGASLNNTLFSGKVTFSKDGDTHLMYGGKVAGGGIELAIAKDQAGNATLLRLRNPKGSESAATFNEIKFYPDVAGVTLVGQELDLKLSMQYIDNDGKGAANDLKLGVWFGGKLYNNNYIYINDYVDNSHSMGTWMAFAITGGAKMNIKSVGTINWKDFPEGLKEITFRDFGFINGDVTKYPSGEYEGDTLDNTLFTGKITFPKKDSAHIMYGGKVAGGGFDIVPAKNETTGEWYLRLFDTNQDKTGRKFTEYKFYENVAGVPLVGEEVALSLSLQYVDHDNDGKKDDVKLGVWFGGKLYNNNYIYLDNFADTGHSMGTWMAFSVDKTTKIKIESVGKIDWKPLPEGFTVLEFKDFGFKPGSYEGGTKTGNCERESMDKTILSGVIMYSKEGETHFTYAGKKGLSGIDLVNVKDEKTGEYYLRLFDTNADKKGKKFTDMYFYSDVAGVPLVGEELDIKISLEYVNHDGGKTDNDLKLGMWFGGKLYNNRYIYIDNYVDNSHSVGSYMTVWVRNGATFNVGRISEWLDWSAFGLTANWKKTLLDTDFNLERTLAGGSPYTGDHTTIPYLAMALSLAVIVICGFQIVRRRLDVYGEQR